MWMFSDSGCTIPWSWRVAQDKHPAPYPTRLCFLLCSMSKRRFSVEAASRPRRFQSHGEELPDLITRARPSPRSLLLQGKYVGREFKDVAKEDRSYVEWALREEKSGELSPNLAAFVCYVKHTFGGIMTVGKHKDLYFTELVEKDPDYASWCSTVGAPGDVLREFADWHVRAGPTACSSTRVDKEADDNNSCGKKCMFCLEKPMSSAWVPCGHMVACYGCATSMPHPQRCPICRQLGLIQKLYVG